MMRLLPLAALVWAASAQAQIGYGDPVPQASTAYAAADGSRSSLADAQGRAGLAVVFWNNTCPWTQRYAPRLADLVRRYGPAGVGFVLINASEPDDERQSAEASRQYLSEAGLAVPYLADPDGSLAAAFGATNAPHAFFFGPDGLLRYDGTLDDSPASANRVRTPYLAQAMDQSVAGLPIEIQRTQAFGCTLRRPAP